MVPILRCPRCKAERSLELCVQRRDVLEVRDGVLACRACGGHHEVQDGIVDLLHDPPEFVLREARGLERFAEEMRNDGWDRERILALPNVDIGYWFNQSVAMSALLADVELEPGRRILDVGSNTCWASNIFARRGLNVVALDIAKTELQGLRTAEFFIGRDGVYFERLLSLMFDVALASESMDYVFCSEVLHHNDLRNLERTMRELHRVLRPGGSLLVLNEPLRFLFKLKRDHARDVAHLEGYEHVWFLHQYYLAARRAGFRVEVRDPASEEFFGPWSETICPETSIGHALHVALAHSVRKHTVTRRLALAYRMLLVGDVSLSMVATKPGTLGPVRPSAPREPERLMA